MPGAQQSLEGFEADTTPCDVDDVHKPGKTLYGYGFFLALVPASEPEEATLFKHSCELHRRFGVSDSKIQSADRMHATMLDLGAELEEDGLPSQLSVAGISAALTGVSLPSASVRFTSIRGFAGDALTLRSKPGDHQEFIHLRSLVSKLLKGRAGKHPRSSGQPHISLQYRLPRSIGQHPIEPIDWNARRLALILSHRGLGHYQILADWNLL